MAAVGMDAVACVARDLDDPRAIFVPVDQLANVHVATDCGGRRRALARPSLAGYMWPELIPPGAAFGYSGEHRDGRPMRIKVLVQEDRTSADVLASLSEQAAGAKLRRRYRPLKQDGALTPEMLQAARSLLAESLPDGLTAGRIAEMSDRAVRRAIGRHFPGGVDGFTSGEGLQP